MNKTPSQSESRAMLKWLNHNRQQLKQYARQYVAYNASGIIANSENLREVLQLAEASGELFSIYLVPGFTASYQFRLHRNDIEETAVPCPYRD